MLAAIIVRFSSMLLAANAPVASGHGYVVSPISKNQLAYLLRGWNTFPSDMPDDFRYEPWTANHGNMAGQSLSGPAYACGSSEDATAHGLYTWQAWYDAAGVAVPSLQPGSDLEVTMNLPADHGGQAWMMIACASTVADDLDWTFLERAATDRDHHFLPGTPTVFAWETGESASTDNYLTAFWTVPADYQCANSEVVGRWLWKTGNSCNDIENVGRSTEKFDLEEYRLVVHAFAPGTHVQEQCTAPPEIFISCFDFVMDGSGSGGSSDSSEVEDFVPLDGGSNRACRGASEDDDDESYYTLHGAPDLYQCEQLCRSDPDCKGIEHHAASGLCEVWTREEGIGATADADGYVCLVYSPAAPGPEPEAEPEAEPEEEPESEPEAEPEEEPESEPEEETEPEPETTTPAPAPPAPGALCYDLALPIEWSGGGVHTCATYGLAYCGHEALADACCVCGGGSSTPAPEPPSCDDGELPAAWAGGGAYDCQTYEDLGIAYCAHAAIAEVCCFCVGSGYSLLQGDLPEPPRPHAKAAKSTKFLGLRLLQEHTAPMMWDPVPDTWSVQEEL